jgi:hypothetical protein
MMRRILLSAAFSMVMALCLGLAPGCSDDDGKGTEPDLLTVEDFAGSWNATKFLVKSQDNPMMQFDLITAGGSASWVAGTDGTFTGQAVIPSAPPDEPITLPLTGTFTLVDQQHATVTFTPEYPPIFTSFTAEFTLSGDTLEILDTSTTFDFDEDGTEEPAIFEGTMVRS